MNYAEQVLTEVRRAIVGKDDMILKTFLTMISGGHLLLEDKPGVGKTTLAVAFSRALQLDYKRMQFTPDVMSSDITGFTMYNKASEKFEYRQGLIMTNVFIADEINRTSPKTQSALLEAMEEKKVTVDGVTHSLPTPFMVIATENEFGYVGTFPLPEAQLDRFLLKLTIGYPDLNDEMMILYSRKTSDPLDSVTPICSADDIIACVETVKEIHIEPAVYKYIVEIVSATRNHPVISLGASPRASLALMRAAQSCAFMDGRDYITPEDIAQMATYVLPHRIHLTQEARVKHITVENIIAEIMKATKPPFSGNAE